MYYQLYFAAKQLKNMAKHSPTPAQQLLRAISSGNCILIDNVNLSIHKRTLLIRGFFRKYKSNPYDLYYIVYQYYCDVSNPLPYIRLEPKVHSNWHCVLFDYPLLTHYQPTNCENDYYGNELECSHNTHVHNCNVNTNVLSIQLMQHLNRLKSNINSNIHTKLPRYSYSIQFGIIGLKKNFGSKLKWNRLCKKFAKSCDEKQTSTRNRIKFLSKKTRKKNTSTRRNMSDDNNGNEQVSTNNKNCNFIGLTCNLYSLSKQAQFKKYGFKHGNFEIFYVSFAHVVSHDQMSCHTRNYAKKSSCNVMDNRGIYTNNQRRQRCHCRKNSCSSSNNSSCSSGSGGNSDSEYSYSSGNGYSSSDETKSKSKMDRKRCDRQVNDGQNDQTQVERIGSGFSRLKSERSMSIGSMGSIGSAVTSVTSITSMTSAGNRKITNRNECQIESISIQDETKENPENQEMDQDFNQYQCDGADADDDHGEKNGDCDYNYNYNCNCKSTTSRYSCSIENHCDYVGTVLYDNCQSKFYDPYCLKIGDTIGIVISNDHDHNNNLSLQLVKKQKLFQKQGKTAKSVKEMNINCKQQTNKCRYSDKYYLSFYKNGEKIKKDDVSDVNSNFYNFNNGQILLSDNYQYYPAISICCDLRNCFEFVVSQQY